MKKELALREAGRIGAPRSWKTSEKWHCTPHYFGSKPVHTEVGRMSINILIDWTLVRHISSS